MSPTRLIPTLAIALALIPAGTALAGGDEKVVKVKDQCDAETFNAALGEGACTPINDQNHTTDFDDAIEEMTEDGEVDYWKFSPRKAKIDSGDTVRVVFKKGGEGHTFTEVPVFGPGCVTDINGLLGLVGAPAADCALIEPTFVGPQRREFTIENLSVGVHRFECLIHPWMQSTITVR